MVVISRDSQKRMWEMAERRAKSSGQRGVRSRDIRVGSQSEKHAGIVFQQEPFDSMVMWAEVEMEGVQTLESSWFLEPDGRCG